MDPNRGLEAFFLERDDRMDVTDEDIRELVGTLAQSTPEVLYSSSHSQEAPLAHKRRGDELVLIPERIKKQRKDDKTQESVSEGVVERSVQSLSQKSSSRLQDEIAARIAKLNAAEGGKIYGTPGASSGSSVVSSRGSSTDTQDTAKSRSGSVDKRGTPAKKEVKLPSMTPEQYVLHILEQRKLDPKISPPSPHLHGLNIFYCGGDYENACEDTRKKLSLLLKFGFNLQPKFDPGSTTQIVVGGLVSLTALASKIGYKSWKEIPESIPTLTWNWAADCRSSANSAKNPDKVRKLPEYWKYSAYPQRLHAGSTVTAHSTLINAKQPSANIIDAVDSDDSDEDKSEPAGLGGFYALAKQECSSSTDAFGIDADLHSTISAETERREATSIPKTNSKACVNQKVVDKLSELKNLHMGKPGEDNQWRVRTYSKAIKTLESYDKPIKSYEQALALRGIGKKTADKIMEIINTGDLRRIAHENTDDVKVTRMFLGIYGVGQTTALTWYKKGCRTLDDLKAGKYGVKLSNAQRIGLEYYDDINDRMPREEAKALFDLIKPIALKIDPNLFIEIMGSYRRGKADCGDIDILITRCTDDDKTHEGILVELIRKLHEARILTEDLALPENPHDLEGIYRGLCRLPSVKGSRRRRIDFLTVPWISRGAALLYYTGDDIFNRAMRLKASHLKFSLNQRGLFEGVVRDPRNRIIKLGKGNLLASETEEEIFRILKVPYVQPHERVGNLH